MFPVTAHAEFSFLWCPWGFTHSSAHPGLILGLLPGPQAPRSSGCVLAGCSQVRWAEPFDLAQPWMCLFSRRLVLAPFPVLPGPPSGRRHSPLKTTQQPSQLTPRCLLAEPPEPPRPSDPRNIWALRKAGSRDSGGGGPGSARLPLEQPPSLCSPPTPRLGA